MSVLAIGLSGSGGLTLGFDKTICISNAQLWAYNINNSNPIGSATGIYNIIENLSGPGLTVFRRIDICLYPHTTASHNSYTSRISYTLKLVLDGKQCTYITGSDNLVGGSSGAYYSHYDGLPFSIFNSSNATSAQNMYGYSDSSSSTIDTRTDRCGQYAGLIAIPYKSNIVFYYDTTMRQTSTTLSGIFTFEGYINIDAINYVYS